VPVEESPLADLAGVVAAGVEFAVVSTLYGAGAGAGAGGLATQPSNISRVTWTAHNAFANSHM